MKDMKNTQSIFLFCPPLECFQVQIALQNIHLYEMIYVFLYSTQYYLHCQKNKFYVALVS